MNRHISKLEVHEKEPEGFTPQVHVAGCYLEIDNKILLLQRGTEKTEAGKWGVPAGKIEKNESPENAAKRELFEETGISFENGTQFQQLNSLYIRKPEIDYVYHMFKAQIDSVPEVQISDEHQSYKWATLNDINTLHLMDGAKEALESYQLLKNNQEKKGVRANVNSYLILRKDNKILFNLRKNTGYCDGMWCLIAGHVEKGESATFAMIREANEEIGIQLSPNQIKVVHIMYSHTNRHNVDIFFDCPIWDGTIENCEPDKCEKLEFYSIDELPKNTVSFNVWALKSICNNEFYSEKGWDE